VQNATNRKTKIKYSQFLNKSIFARNLILLKKLTIFHRQKNKLSAEIALIKVCALLLRFPNQAIRPKGPVCPSSTAAPFQPFLHLPPAKKQAICQDSFNQSLCITLAVPESSHTP